MSTFFLVVNTLFFIHSISTPPSPKPAVCARLLVTPGIGPKVYRKEDISRHDCTTARYLLHRPISTKLKDLSRGQTNAGWAKYAYFSRLASTGLLLACLGLGLGAPLSVAHARDFSYLSEKKVNKTDPQTVRLEAQNSQTLALLESAVNVDPKKALGGGDIIVVNDSALLPEEGPSGTIADIQSNDNQGKEATVYVVHANDTIAGIAKMFEVSTNTILWANGLPSGASLHEGQTLMILPVDGVQHTIKKGETINGLAKKYGGKATDILEFNDLTAGQALSIGDIIIIPNGKEGVESAPSVSSSASTLSRVRARLIATFPEIDGYYINPAPEGHKTQGIHGYNGVDIGAPKGTPVYAAAEGIVTASHYRAGDPWFGGYGNYIDIDHPNGTQTRYGHLSKVYVQVGAHVDQGQEIGAVGNTGHSTGSHLHFEVHGAKNPGADWSWRK